MWRHLAVGFAFVALAVAWSFPLALHLSTHLPGAAIGDNVVFLWNFWWMRTALASGAGFFHTPYLFAPAGVDLTLHTHTALAAFTGATVLKSLPLVAAVNVTTLAALSLNGFCTYLMAWRMTRDRTAALFAGMLFGWSPYIAAHLNGHFNLTMAWTLPLFAIAFSDAMRGSWRWGMLSGALLALTAYIDYYYVVYEFAFALCLVAVTARTWSLRLRTSEPYPRWLSMAVRSLIVVDICVIGVIVATGGFARELGPFRISARDIFNPLQILWGLVGLALWMHFRPRATARPAHTWSTQRMTPVVAAMLATFLVFAAPLVWNGIRLLLSGDYVSQQYFWRSAPVGIDTATFVLGNPFQGFWGSPIRHLYSRLGIDAIESVAWLGLVPVALSVYALRRRPNDPSVRQWTVVAAVFLVWALGSHVSAFGRNTGMIGPAALLRFVPIISNARMPGRAMVMVYLAMATLAALGLSQYRAGRGRPWVALSLMAIVALADFFAAPFPIVPIQCPTIYETLRDRPERGAVAELPLGFGDGLGAVTPVDNGMLACQTIHQRPLVGGFVARLPPHVLATYRSDPLLSAWLDLSGAHGANGQGLPDLRLSAERLKADDVAFVMLNRARATAALRDYVEHGLPLTLIAEDESHALYVATYFSISPVRIR